MTLQYGDKLSSDLSLNGFLGERAPSTRALLPTASGASTRPSSPVEHSAFHAPRLMESIISQGKTYLVTLTENKLGSVSILYLFIAIFLRILNVNSSLTYWSYSYPLIFMIGCTIGRALEVKPDDPGLFLTKIRTNFL